MFQKILKKDNAHIIVKEYLLQNEKFYNFLLNFNHNLSNSNLDAAFSELPVVEEYQNAIASLLKKIPFDAKIDDQELKTKIIDIQMKVDSETKETYELLKLHEKINKKAIDNAKKMMIDIALEDNNYNSSGRIELSKDELNKFSLQRVI